MVAVFWLLQPVLQPLCPSVVELFFEAVALALRSKRPEDEYPFALRTLSKKSKDESYPDAPIVPVALPLYPGEDEGVEEGCGDVPHPRTRWGEEVQGGAGHVLQL